MIDGINRLIAMKTLALTSLLAVSALCTHHAAADVGAYEREEVNKNTFTSPDKTAVLTVSMERIDRKQIKQVNMGKNKAPEAWLGKRKLPSDVLWRRATLLSSFSLKIDGKKVNIPERFWNDLVGFNLHKIVVNKKPTNPEEEWELEKFTNSVWNPKVSRSRDGGTVLISWIRPEE